MRPIPDGKQPCERSCEMSGAERGNRGRKPAKGTVEESNVWRKERRMSSKEKDGQCEAQLECNFHFSKSVRVFSQHAAS